jgi:hypothetical protein
MRRPSFIREMYAKAILEDSAAPVAWKALSIVGLGLRNGSREKLADVEPEIRAAALLLFDQLTAEPHP